MKEVAGLMFLVMLSWAHLYPFPLQVKEWKDMVGPTHDFQHEDGWPEYKWNKEMQVLILPPRLFPFQQG